MIKSMLAALGTFSVLPVPHIYQTGRNLKYSLPFLFLPGAITGLLLFGLCLLCFSFSLPPVLFSALAAFLPLLIPRGITVGGFLHTLDARLSSHASRAERAAALQDPYRRTPSIIGAVFLFLGSFLLWQQIYSYENLHLTAAAALGYGLIHTLAGLSIAVLRPARSKGLIPPFKEAVTTTGEIILILEAVLFAGAMAVFSPIAGGACVVTILAKYFFHRLGSYKKFGGITEETLGFFTTSGGFLMLLMLASLGWMASPVELVSLHSLFPFAFA